MVEQNQNWERSDQPSIHSLGLKQLRLKFVAIALLAGRYRSQF